MLWYIADCGSNQTVVNGRIKFYSRTTYGEHAVSYCDHGFKRNGELFPVCLADGFWESVTCEPVGNVAFKGSPTTKTSTCIKIGL